MSTLEVGSFYEISFEYPKVTNKYYVVSKKPIYDERHSYFLIEANHPYAKSKCDIGAYYWENLGYSIKTKYYNPLYADVRKLAGEELEQFKAKLYHFKKFWSYPYV